VIDPDARLARRRAPRSRRWPKVLALALGACLLFLAGLGLGLALEDRPVPGGTETSVRTLEPLPPAEP
jgi:hypothetical protein